MNLIERRREMSGVLGEPPPPVPNPPAPRVPSGYTELRYVITDSQAWIDTGVAGASDLELEIRYRHQTYVQYAPILGNYIDEEHNAWRVIQAGSATAIYVTGGQRAGSSTSVTTSGNNVVNTLVLTSSTATMNGTSTAVGTTAGTENTTNICLGNNRVNSTVNKDISLRIWYFKIKKNGVLIRDYVPAMRDSDSAVGFYDVVNDTFKTSDSNTDFLPGYPNKGLPYIRARASAYIDTGITPDGTTQVVIWARNFAPLANLSPMLIGACGSGWNVDSFILYCAKGNSTGGIGMTFADNSSVYFNNAWQYLGHYHKYSYGKDGLYIDDYKRSSVTAGTFSNPVNLHLFGYNNNGTHVACSMPIDIFACKIYKGGELVRDFTPVASPEVGMYDAVSDTVFTNAGSGSFSYGTFNPFTYMPTLSCGFDKNQYFDTGLIASNSSIATVNFYITSTAKTFKRLFGVRESDGVDQFELMIGNESYANRYFYGRYGPNSKTIYNSASQSSAVLTYFQNGVNYGLYKGTSNISTLGTGKYTAATFTTTRTMYVGASNSSGYSQLNYGFYGRIYYINLSSGGTGLNVHSYVPAFCNYGGVWKNGYYDITSDTFYPSATDALFTAGSLI